MKAAKSIIYLGFIAIAAITGTGCKKADEVYNIAIDKFRNSFDISGKESVLYVERPGNLDCVFPWSSFMDFGLFDLTDVQAGTIKLRTGTPSGGVTSIMFDPELGDRAEFDFDEILFAWTNEASATNLTITSTPVAVVPDPDDSVQSIKLFNVENGIEFAINNWNILTAPEMFQFTIWASKTTQNLKEYINLFRKPFKGYPYKDNVAIPAGFTIYFNKSAFSGISMAGKENLAWTDRNPAAGVADIDISSSSDTRFERIISECMNFVDNNSLFNKSSVSDDNNYELFLVDSCHQNLREYFTDLLLSRTLNPRPRSFPEVDSTFDDHVVLYSNIYETVKVVSELKDDLDQWWQVVGGSRAWEAVFRDEPQLQEYLLTLVNQTSGGDIAGPLSRLILHYTDYLLYGALCSLYDADFNSRYFNHLNGLVREVDNLLHWFHSALENNNIVIRFYAVASLYDFMKSSGTMGYFDTFTQYFTDKCTPANQYGEGYDYLNYIYSVALPVLYLGVQEEYTMGPLTGQKWINSAHPAVQTVIASADQLLDATDLWGELPAYNDGFNTISWLTPLSVIADDFKYLDYTNKTEDLLSGGAFETDIPGAFGVPNPEMRLLMYPHNRTFSQNAPYNPPSDTTIVTGSIVKMHVTNSTTSYDEQISLTLIAEEDPSYAGTHDKIDHGAIQLNRCVDRGSGNRHTSHLIISPGYPGFVANKRETEEWRFVNQNTLMMYNRDIEDTDTIEDANLPVVYNDHELNIDIDAVTLLDPEAFGGMSGYCFASQDDMISTFKDVLTTSDFMAGRAIKKMTSPLLNGDAGGKSEVVRTFRNGVQTKITYNYLYPHDAVIHRDWTVNNNLISTNLVEITRRSDCSGRREVYNLGNSFYIVDRFLPDEHPTIADLDFATSWNMPENTVPVAGRPGCFEGTRSATPGGVVESRIQLCCKGFTGIAIEPDTFSITKAYSDSARIDQFKVNQLYFSNNLSSSNFQVTELRISDGFETFKTINTETYATTGQTVWDRIYTDGSMDSFIINPQKVDYTYQGITTNAYIMIVSLDGNGTGNTRLFDYTNVTAPTHTITFTNGGQCDIQM